MEANTLAIGLSACAIGMFGAFVIYSLEHDHVDDQRIKALARTKELREELENAELRKERALTRLAEAKSTALNAREEMSQVKSDLAKTEANVEKGQTELKSLKERLKSARKEKETAIERNRASAVGRVYPEIILSNGRILQDAKLTRFSPEEISFVYRGGRGSFRWSQLPQDFIERFALGIDLTGETIADNSIADNIISEEIITEERIDKTDYKTIDYKTIQRKISYAELRLRHLENAIKAAERKAAPNPMLVNKLQDQKVALEKYIEPISN